MKFIKVTALAAAMAASFGAQAELQAMEDDALEAVTGQAGITIVQALEITNLDVAYTDTDATGGTLGLDSISTSAMVMTQTVDVINKATYDAATSATATTATANDAVLAVAVTGISGTISIGGIYVGTDTTVVGAGAANAAATATSLGSVTLGNLTTGAAGITSYIFAH